MARPGRGRGLADSCIATGSKRDKMHRVASKCCQLTFLTKMSSPSSLSSSAMSDTSAPGSSIAGKGGGFRSELAAILAVVMGLDVGGSRSEVSGKWGRAKRERERESPAGRYWHYSNTHTAVRVEQGSHL